MLEKYIKNGFILSTVLHVFVASSLLFSLSAKDAKLHERELCFEVVSYEDSGSVKSSESKNTEVEKLLNEIKNQPNLLDRVKKFEKTLKDELAKKVEVDRKKEIKDVKKPQNKVEKKEPKKEPKAKESAPKNDLAKNSHDNKSSKSNTNHLSGKSGSSAAPTQSELANFVSKVRCAIDDLWHMENFNDSKALEATVEFSISPSGQLIYVKIIKNSGNNHFDNILISLFKKLPTIKPPSAQALTFSLTFKSNKD